MFKLLIVLFLPLLNTCLVQSAEKVHGIVFLDRNHNGMPDNGEKGVKGVCVSNGIDVVATNNKGEWDLPASEKTSLFVIKPAGFSVLANKYGVTQHFIHGSGSGPFHFPLYPEKTTGKFSALFFGDTQARGLREVNFVNHDVVEECIDSGASFGVALGDIMADGPALFPEISEGIAQTGIPWYYIFGNHDFDRDAKTATGKYKPFEDFFGLLTFAFEYGEVVFIGLNNIYIKPDGRSISHFTDDQLAFVGNYLAYVPKNKLIVLMMHSPIVACDNREKLFRLIENYPNTFSISGHLHEQVNLFLSEKEGWKGPIPHHHLINATVCGSWWCGILDERGIPHATMNDGAPNGYSIIHFEGNKYRIQFKPAGRPENYQMNIFLPDDIEQKDSDTTQVLVNVFSGSERSKVELKVDQAGNWTSLTPFKTIDPYCLAMSKLSPYLRDSLKGKALEDIFGYCMDFPSVSRHIWKGKLPAGLSPGTHTLFVKTTDVFNQTWTSARIFRIR